MLKLMKLWMLFSGLLLSLIVPREAEAQVSDSSLQLVTATSDSWSSFRAKLQYWERSSPRSPWKPVLSEKLPVLLGKKGLAWGVGAFEVPAGTEIPLKMERDWKAPAGIFNLGKVHGYAKQGPSGSVWPYHQVGAWDAWIDDPKHPQYNRHVVVDSKNPPSWFPKQRMRLGDFAYTWLLEIQHNANPPIPHRGSAIFFHVRRGPDRASAGCTTMKKEDLEDLIRWLQWEKKPQYVLLPQATYEQLRKSWKLP